MSFPVNRLIHKFGETIKIKKRTTTVDANGTPTYAYNTIIEARGLLTSVSGFREIWWRIGYSEDVDYIILFRKDVDLDNGDIIELSNGLETEVKEVVERRFGKQIDFLEALCSKVA